MKKKKLFLLLFILIVSVLLILINFYTIKVLSAVKTYINGESEYSKGQKDASLYLATYVQTGDLKYWHSFKEAMDVPLGDNIALDGLTNGATDKMIAKGFLMGRNHPSDIPDMIWLFKTFHANPFMKKAILIWSEAAPLINELDSMANSLHPEIEQHRLTVTKQLASMEAITLLSSKLSIKERAFSYVLNEASREFRKYLQYANIFFILLMIGSIALFAINAINSLSAFEKELNNKINELNAKNDELERFTYMASHDLQEPLRMVSGFVGLLEKKYSSKLDKQAISYIHFAVDGANRMKTLINDLLDYSRTDIKKLAIEKVAPDDIISGLRLIFNDDLQDTGVGIFSDGLPEINANAMQMTQLFQNLLSNSIKYRGAAAPEIHIAAKDSPTYWTFSVKDNGEGIAAKNFDKIFELFQRLRSNTTHTGTGIGLATCKKIVERHGGKIWVQSEQGEGSTFYFTISKKLK